MFSTLRLILSIGGVVLLLGIIGGVGLMAERHGEASARAELQPQLDAAHQALGTLAAQLATSAAAVRAYEANDRANAALIEQYQTAIAASDQRAADIASTIRKLQTNDQTVADFLRTRIPDALCRVLNDGDDTACAGDPDRGAAAAAH